jgi:uncharacterized protein YndB with AHSA1/START domain
MEVQVPYVYTLTTTIPATAQEIYDAWLDSLAHSEMTGSEASMSDEVGAEVSAWDGYITGRNLELVPGERIVQSWRTTEFTDEHGDSIVTLTLEDADGETLLTLVHSDVPDDQTNYEEGGWQGHYFDPMREYFADRRGEGGKSRAAATKAKRGAARTKTKRGAARTKTKRAARKVKTTAANRKPRSAAAAKTTLKSAKKAKRVAAKGPAKRKRSE